MLVVFISNYFNHHQKPFCDEMVKLLGEGNFFFIATNKISDWRKELGYKELVENYVKHYNEEINQLILSADVALFGHTLPYLDSIIKYRLSKKRLTIKVSERIYKKSVNFFHLLYHRYKFYKSFGNSPYSYLLAASAYAPLDYSKLGVFKNRMLKWGYFPELKLYNVSSLLSEKESNSILWCSRFIDWKHPELALMVAKKLKEDGIPFKLRMIGTGNLLDSIKKEVTAFELNDKIELLGPMSPDKVRDYMEKSEVFLMTSDQNEGWGVVLNESMNSACAVVANHSIGAVPYLLSDKNNGLVYKTQNELYDAVKFLLRNTNKRKEIAIAANQTITDLWSPNTAAINLCSFLYSFANGKQSIPSNGPCSTASIIVD